MNKRVKFIHGDEALLDQIRVLWEALNSHHLGLSTNFKQHYLDMTFERRKGDLLKKAATGKMRVDLAVDEAAGQNVGYCVSSLNQEMIGEVESIFVGANYRGSGIGDSLMKKALCWMDQEGAVAKIVEVASGNEEAFCFYAKYGFLPRKTVLKQMKPSDTC
jgi:ribosomal protein S18 acetylase RimI-like enzyme